MRARVHIKGTDLVKWMPAERARELVEQGQAEYAHPQPAPQPTKPEPTGQPPRRTSTR